MLYGGVRKACQIASFVVVYFRNYSPYAVQRLQYLLPEHVAHRAVSDNAAVLDSDQPLTVSCCMIEVMHDHDDDNVPCLIQMYDQFHQIQLMVNVQIGRRFVQKQNLRLFGNRHGKPGPLPFTAGQGR